MSGCDANVGYECKKCGNHQSQFEEQSSAEVGMEFDESDDVWSCNKCGSKCAVIIFFEKKSVWY